MKRLLNTLYITNEKSFLHAENQNILIKEGENSFKIPIINLENIVIFSYLGASSEAIKLCGDNNISINFISPSGRYMGCFCRPQYGNIITRKKQYRICEDEKDSLFVSQNIVKAKAVNQKSVLLRYIRDNKRDDLKSNIILFDSYLNKIYDTQNYNELLGIEGTLSKIYFNVFPELIKQSDFVFLGRNKNPPRDMVNSLLSLFYVILTNRYTAALNSVGLDSYSGFYHKDRSGRNSLSCDLMEELRAPLVDRFVLNLINNRIITKKDFEFDFNNIPTLKKDSLKVAISYWQKRMRDEIKHPFLNEKIEIGLIPYAQSMVLSKYIRGELDNYCPFLWT